MLEDSHKLTPKEQEIDREQLDVSDKEEEDTNEREEDIIQRAIRIQLEKERESKESKDGHIDSFHKAHKTDPVLMEQRTAPSFNVKAPPQASENCNPGTATGSVAPSCASPVSEREPMPSPEDTTSEPGRLKDEL